MELILKKKRADDFVIAMDGLDKKFRKYLSGELCNYVKLAVVDKRLELLIDNTVPEMIRIACYNVFTETLL